MDNPSSDIPPPFPPENVSFYTGATVNLHSFESEYIIVGNPGDTVVTVDPFSDAKTDIRSFAGLTYRPFKETKNPKGLFYSFGLEVGMVGRDLQDTNINTANEHTRMKIHDEKSLVANATVSNGSIALTALVGYSDLDLTARGWIDDNGNGEPDDISANEPNYTRRFTLPGFTLGGGLTFQASDTLAIRLETDKTWYKAKSFSFTNASYTDTIKPRTENIAFGATYKF